MPTNKPDFCPEDVATHIRNNPGIRYIGHDIAKSFRVKSSDMRMMLSELAEAGKISVSGHGKSRVYFVRSPAEIRASQGLNERPLLTVKPYNPSGVAYQIMLGRVAEARAIPSLHFERK
ncbi:hypothetical protein [Glaciimonas immobilis]|uniref:DNA-binding protein n=1 Tax=Glaciimonas immobilis TaxID=728004 RepID=A0A840RSL5_9BURK|nr:hypothetical protein [Glaciimonas immobilis]KAF3997522.1 hypothetical protein HAV38_12650 [Glaciimonas immobilis]MBB5200795.1 hypothetical protein [Glaciimonas immobilis]